MAPCTPFWGHFRLILHIWNSRPAHFRHTDTHQRWASAWFKALFEFGPAGALFSTSALNLALNQGPGTLKLTVWRPERLKIMCPAKGILTKAQDLLACVTQIFKTYTACSHLVAGVSRFSHTPHALNTWAIFLSLELWSCSTVAA